MSAKKPRVRAHSARSARYIRARIERFEQLIRVLQGLSEHEKRDHFDMTTWAHETPACGTSACAAGWAAQDAWFRRRGFRLVRSPLFHTLYPFYRGYRGWDALQAFFGSGFEAGWASLRQYDEHWSLGPIFSDPRTPEGVIGAARARIGALKRLLQEKRS